MTKEEIKKILENHLKKLSKISENEMLLVDNPILLQVINDGLKTISLTIITLDKI